ncbi:cation diffusion facilitator family transporter [Acuticoccus sp. MNP-M23]|uniref:cation diffusion facilitator family transporter n=1 Tax=Acuticoccus sp. MNP-M23 TaxID=3072793 RepID=UPI0028155737|nr:cation diffusion facilitator family transporter [Acuticoccus sp. MNP-M23]WMS41470.1 cation diffusion facilitator family transporter [Acuticoccus sp. MNP-M23]
MSAKPTISASNLAAASIAVGIAVLGIKFAAWGLTGSVALLSDALESVVNVGAAIAALFAVRLSQLPADENHPYGHHKVEYLSAVLEGALIVLAAFLILREAIGGFMNPQQIEAPWLGLAINASAGAINAAWAVVLIRFGRRHRSPALSADGRHLAADTVTTVGVLLGLILSVVTGWAILDPLLAGAVACNVIWSGWSLIRESVGGLMDAAPPPDELDRIREAIAKSAGGAIEAHDLRARHAGRRTFVDFHLVVPEDMNVTDAHEICDRIERAVRKTVGEALISIHVEPEHKSKHQSTLAADPAAILIEGHEALRTYH